MSNLDPVQALALWLVALFFAGSVARLLRAGGW